MSKKVVGGINLFLALFCVQQRFIFWPFSKSCAKDNILKKNTSIQQIQNKSQYTVSENGTTELQQSFGKHKYMLNRKLFLILPDQFSNPYPYPVRVSLTLTVPLFPLLQPCQSCPCPSCAGSHFATALNPVTLLNQLPEYF